MNVVAKQPRKLDIETFLAFYDTRPDEEQWQLINGVALLMTPPFLAHQRIAGNLQRLLNDALERHASHLRAEQRVGIELPQFEHYRPEPDVAVIDLEIPSGRRYADRFYLVAEILSKSDDERIDLKREFYRAHEHNRCTMLITQEIAMLEIERRTESGWSTEVLRDPDSVVRLPGLGLTCQVGDLYKNTSLAGS